MPLPFTQRVKLAMAYAEKKPAAVTPDPPLTPGEQITAFAVAIPDAEAPVSIQVVRKADEYAVVFSSGATVIQAGIVPRHDVLFDVIEKVRLSAAKKPLPATDGGLGDKLDALLLA